MLMIMEASRNNGADEKETKRRKKIASTRHKREKGGPSDVDESICTMLRGVNRSSLWSLPRNTNAIYIR